MKRAIVLSGGGAKGAYEIGVWKALRKLHIKYDIVTGTSVGALNGVFLVQNDYLKAKKLWNNINFELIFDNKVLERFNNAKNTKDLILMFGTNLIKQGGMDVHNLENLVNVNFNHRKFFKSKKDYGIVTFNSTKLKPCILKKKDLTKDNLKDYVIASASCFPFFKMKEIEEDKYMDGGFYDNLPINLAIEMNADEIIAIDLKAPGIIRPIPRQYKDKVTYIKPHNNLGHFLNFNKEQSKKNIKFGYNDTLKVFNKLDGIHYTFKKNQIKKLSKKYQDIFFKNLENALNNDKKKILIDSIITDLTRARIFGIKEKDLDKIFLETLEYAAKSFDINETKIYNYKTFNRRLIKAFISYKDTKLNMSIDTLKSKKYNNFENSKKVILQFSKLLDKSNTKDISNLAISYPKEFLSSIYLKTISR